MIIDAIDATGALDDGHITTAETYDIGDWISTHDFAAFVAAHGNDENGLETGFHLVQGDGGTSYLFGEDAVNTVMDQIYHIGFPTVGDRFLNEDGDANQRVEVVGDWLNRLLGDGASGDTGGGTAAALLGSAARPDVVVQSGLNNRLAADAATLTLKGSASNATGNAHDNMLVGNEQANQLDGRAGDDVLRGGAGDDTLVGGAGADTMTGGTGNDIYWVDNAADVVRESSGAGGGIDTVMLTGDAVASYAAGAGIEWVKVADTGADAHVTGNGLDNTIITARCDDTVAGGAGDDTIETGSGADVLTGGAGDDYLDGGRGADTMSGGAGNDWYLVDSAKDTVTEKTDEGTDTVQASVSYGLTANVEALQLVGMAKNGTGNALDNTIDGNDADNRIDGGKGADTMAGNGGNDVYLVDNALDKVVEDSGNGIDRVETGLSWTLGDNVENLRLNGTADVSGTGNNIANVVTGNDGDNALSGLAGDDVLAGGKGADRLTGGEGMDKLTGGAGADVFVFTALGDSTVDPAGRDTITDFSHADGDRIDLSGIDANGAGSAAAAFHFASAFDGTAGALIVTGKAGAWLVQGDIDGDKVADLAIMVASKVAPVEADFVL